MTSMSVKRKALKRFAIINGEDVRRVRRPAMVVVKEMRMSNLVPAACPERSLNRPGPDY